MLSCLIVGPQQHARTAEATALLSRAFVCLERNALHNLSMIGRETIAGIELVTSLEFKFHQELAPEAELLHG